MLVGAVMGEGAQEYDVEEEEVRGDWPKVEARLREANKLHGVGGLPGEYWKAGFFWATGFDKCIVGDKGSKDKVEGFKTDLELARMAGCEQEWM